MKINKNTPLKKIIEELVRVSFINNKLYKPKVDQIIKTLGSLSKGTAIEALSMYLKGIKREADKSRLVIESAIPLSGKQIDRVEDIINRTHPVFETEVIVNPGLLGGMRIKIGDTVFDDSLINKIEQVKEEVVGLS